MSKKAILATVSTSYERNANWRIFVLNLRSATKLAFPVVKVRPI
jgi:hypothetical protein